MLDSAQRTRDTLPNMWNCWRGLYKTTATKYYGSLNSKACVTLNYNHHCFLFYLLIFSGHLLLAR